jgi:pimeloyl-ACP methyl ester carboxylesterase
MQVLLIHGLARTSLSLLSLERRLQRAGHHTMQFSYFAFAESFDHIVERLVLQLQTLASQGPYAVVAHSLGGILTRAALGSHPIPLPHQVVMLGPPNQPPRLAPLAWRLLPFQWFTGQCGQNLSCSKFYGNLPILKTNYTIIAGTLGPRGPFSPFGNESNDGIVALSETMMQSTDRVVQLPVWHTFMMNNTAVQRSVLQALAADQTSSQA